MTTEKANDPVVDPSAPAANTPEATISKEEHTKAISDQQSAIDLLKTDLDKVNSQLLSPEYLQYLDTKKAADIRAKDPAPKEGESTDLAQLRADMASLRETVQTQQQTLANVYYTQELKDTRAKFTDFGDYEESINDFLRNAKKDYTYEEAYHLVRAADGAKSPAASTTDRKSGFASEKPTTTVPEKSLERKDYSTEAESDQATIAQLRDKYPNLGDSL